MLIEFQHSFHKSARDTYPFPWPSDTLSGLTWLAFSLSCHGPGIFSISLVKVRGLRIIFLISHVEHSAIVIACNQQILIIHDNDKNLVPF